jgi:hypothetical protein
LPQPLVQGPNVSALVECLPRQLHPQFPWGFGEISQALRGDLERAHLVIHVTMEFLATRIFGHAVLEFLHFAVELCH